MGARVSLRVSGFTGCQRFRTDSQRFRTDVKRSFDGYFFWKNESIFCSNGTVWFMVHSSGPFCSQRTNWGGSLSAAPEQPAHSRAPRWLIGLGRRCVWLCAQRRARCRPLNIAAYACPLGPCLLTPYALGIMFDVMCRSQVEERRRSTCAPRRPRSPILAPAPGKRCRSPSWE